MHALERAKLAGQRCYGETCPQYLLLDDTRVRQARLRGLGLRHEPADPARERRPPRRAVERPREPDARLRRHRPLSRSPHEQKLDGQGRLHQDPERRRRHRGSPPAALHPRRRSAAASTCRAWSSSAAPRRPGSSGSRRRARSRSAWTPTWCCYDPSGERTLSAQDAPLAGRPQHLRGLRGPRPHRPDDRRRPHALGRRDAHDDAAAPAGSSPASPAHFPQPAGA